MPDIPTHDMGDLIDQLKNADQIIKKPEKVQEEFNLSKENLEEFILNNAGKLIQQSVEMVSDVKQYVETAPEHRDVTSLAELIKASSSAIESLSKVLVQDKKGVTQKEVKQLDIQGKKELLQGEVTAKIMLSRDEVIKELFENAKKAEEEVIDVTQNLPQENS
ncbi:MAG TPA: hypothetical protein DCS66_24520 [Flavobacteriaceae bacterium]|nr:hypothetical protein [Flavobacteriaceae bacterium]|tara:strand:- start:604 stop:1092 length:489 start_codon:yes stop_codon:yes gene_type:complete